MSQEYQQLLKGLKKSEIIDIINNLESKNVELPEDYKSPSTSLKKESLIDVAISIIKANESSEGWNNVLRETPYLDALVDSEDEDAKEEEENKEEDAEENEEEEEDDEEEEEDDEEEEEEEDDCDDCNDCCSFSYEPTLKERVQWKIYDFRWELLNDNIKTFCTSVNGLFKISTTAELLTLFIFVIKFQNSLTFCPYFVERISNQNTLILLKYLEILVYYIGIFVATPLVVSYYFNFLPEPIEEGDEDEEDVEYDDDDDLYASDSEEEYDHLVAPEDEESEEEEQQEEEVNEIPEKEASQEGEDVNELLVNGDEDVYDYEDLDSDYLIDSDIEDDYDYEEYPNLTLVDENEKDSFDPFTYSLAKIAVAYICYRYGTGLCDFNDLVINSNLYEVTIGFGIIGALIGLYN